MKHSESTFRLAGGPELLERTWLPYEPAKAAIVIVHGYAEHSGRYQHVAGRLVEACYAVFAFDMRGHGRSEGERALVRSFDEYTRDLELYLDRVRTRAPGLPLVVLGHSMGGLVVSLLLTTGSDGLHAAVLSGPAIKAGGLASRPIEWILRAVGRLLPRLGLTRLDSSKVSRDPREVAKYDSDPLIYHGPMKAGLISAFSKAVRTLEKNAPGIGLPIAFFHGGADGLADPAGSIVLHERVRSSDKTLRIYDGLYHEIFNEPERDQVLGDVIVWLDAHCPAQPEPTPQSSAKRL